MKGPVLELKASPHVLSGNRVETIMWNVVGALLPVAAFAVYAYGLSGALTLATAVFGCVLAEDLLCRVRGRPSTLTDGSAVITGLLFGLCLPPALPLWMVAVGSLLSMGLGKHLFGGLGQNPFNPALVGRGVLQAAFPVPMTTWMAPGQDGRFTSVAPSTFTAPFSKPSADAMSSATPLAAFKFDGELTQVADLAGGMTGGSVGESSAVMIALGGAWLLARGLINWRIVAAVLGSVALFSAALHGLDPDSYPPTWFALFSGGLFLGAFFMATDYVGSPMTDRGCWIYGGLIGLLVVVIRAWAGLPEGVMYAILLGNAATPHIDNLIQPRVFGTRRAA